MKLFCTGNPEKKTIAYALTCDHASLSSGWDFTDSKTLERFRNTIVEYDVFVNSSYIKSGIQLSLMNIAYQEWQRKNVKGHIVNIGTTLEHTIDTSQYANDKRALRHRSLELNELTGISGVKSTYLILGGVNNGNPETVDYVSPKDIASTILWAISQECRVPLIQLDGVK